MSWLLDYLRQRTKPGDGDCWIWTGSHRGYPAHRRYPVLWFSDRTRVGAHLLAYQAAHGKALRPGYGLRNKCGHRMCINPDHWKAMSLRDLARTTPVSRGPKQSAAVMRGRRKIARLSVEKAREIRAALAAGVVQRRLAEQYGMSVSTISGISTGRLWREPSPFSV